MRGQAPEASASTSTPIRTQNQSLNAGSRAHTERRANTRDHDLGARTEPSSLQAGKGWVTRSLAPVPRAYALVVVWTVGVGA